MTKAALACGRATCSSRCSGCSAKKLGVTQIFAVSDQCRRYKDGYFGNASNYDTIWTARGGVCFDPELFRLDTDRQDRDSATIPAKKRGMYRRRYDMLTLIRQQMHTNYRGLAAISQTLSETV
jgi:uncharacterized protein VirK/YbjX